MEDSKGAPHTAPAPLSAGAPKSAGQTASAGWAQADAPPAATSGLASESASESGSELVIVLCTFPKPEDLGEIAFTLVGENLCACVNILHESLSIYRWKGEIVTNKEVLCLIKTTRARHAALVARLGELHPYDVPEIVTLPTSAVNAPYLAWVKEETAPLGEPRTDRGEPAESDGLQDLQDQPDRADQGDDE